MKRKLSKEEKEELWRKIFPLRIGERVKVLRARFYEQSEFVGKEGEIVDILSYKKRISIGVRLDGFEWDEKIWVRPEWLERREVVKDEKRK